MKFPNPEILALEQGGDWDGQPRLVGVSFDLPDLCRVCNKSNDSLLRIQTGNTIPRNAGGKFSSPKPSATLESSLMLFGVYTQFATLYRELYS